MSYYLLKPNDFPINDFFAYLQRGVRYYQREDFQRAIWEWFSASRFSIVDPIDITHAGEPVQLQCNLEDVSLLFFFYAIYLNKLSGVGQLHHSNTIQNLIFKNGLLCFLENINQEKRIGKYILEKRRDFTYDNLKNYILESRQEGKRVGQFMMEKELLTPQELEDILAQQVLEAVSDTLLTREGEVYFTQREIKERPHVSYSPLKMAFKAAQRRYDVDNFRKEVTDNKAIFRTTPYLGDLEGQLRERLNTNELFILSLIDGFRNIDQLVRFSGANEESIVSILYRLSKIGLIRKTRESAEYEDKEYEEVSKNLGIIFDIYSAMHFKLYQELGRKAQEIVDKARSSLDGDKQNIFEGISLNDPKNMEKNAILGNMGKYFPNEEQRFIFIDIFCELFDNILHEAKRFLGYQLSKRMTDEIKNKITDVENLSNKTIYTERLTIALRDLMQKYG